jgi:uncharacterized protein (TIGR03118 family)
MNRYLFRGNLRRLFTGAAIVCSALAALPATAGYIETVLVTSATDPDLINPWGISHSAGSPFWVSNNGTGTATLYNSTGTKQGLVVTMPAGSAPITGQVFNGTPTFNGDLFIFASENGTIAGWRVALGTTAEQLYGVPGAVYKGLGISTAADTLFAANFSNGTIDLFDSTHSAPIGSFADPTAPAGYAPFNVQNIGGRFYVTFAVQDAAHHDDVAALGNGLVDIFDPVTHTFTRLISNGQLDSPWGLAVAPGTFGEFAGDLLVGNFGNGEINAFNPSTGAFQGALLDAANTPIINPGLWGLIFGNGGNGGSPGSLYFTAGGANEDIGVFGRITPLSSVPEPSSFALLAIGLAGLITSYLRKLN